MQQTFNLADVLLAAMDARLEGVYTAVPGVVQSYDKSTQTASVQPTVRHAYTSEQADRVAETLPLLQHVPVIFQSGGGYRVTFPVKKGDTCWVMFAMCSMDRWLAQGGDDVDPADDRRHAISDAVCIVGLRDLKHSLNNAPDDSMSMGKDDGPTIEITDSEVKVGGSDASEPTFLADTFMTALDTLITSIGSAVGTSGTPAGATAASATITTAKGVFDTAAAAAKTSVTKVK